LILDLSLSSKQKQSDHCPTARMWVSCDSTEGELPYCTEAGNSGAINIIKGNFH